MGCYSLAVSLMGSHNFLEELDFSLNKMNGGEDANENLETFNTKLLRKLQMYFCGNTTSNIDSMKSLIFKRKTLVELDLSHNNIKDEGIYLICGFMNLLCNLQKLNVSGCGITFLGCVHLQTFLNALYKEMTGNFHHKTLGLTELDLGMNSVGDEGVLQLSVILTNSSSNLRVLKLQHCGVTQAGCEYLSAGLYECILTELDLSGNHIKDEGMRKLCRALASPSCTLERLSLRWCGLTSISITFLLAALKSNPNHLAELNYRGNQMSDTKVRVLERLLSSQKYLLRNIDIFQ
ncbi:ribonuclease inhibitor-like isoform 1-T2 [Pholidichthys leucotaenia]